MGSFGKAEREECLARYERDLSAQAGKPLGPDELLNLLGGDGEPDEQARREAIARFLSAADGWRDAAKDLGGAFAAEAGLKGA